MIKVVKNTQGLKHRHTGEVTEFLTSTVNGVERPLSFDSEEIKPRQYEILKSMGEVVDKPEGLDTNPWPDK